MYINQQWPCIIVKKVILVFFVCYHIYLVKMTKITFYWMTLLFLLKSRRNLISFKIIWIIIDIFKTLFCISIACIQSYGENCRYPCSPHCYNHTCDRFNGRCLLCCTDGYRGELCNERPITLNKNESSSSSWNTGLIFSLVINFVQISVTCLLCRKIYTKKVSITRDLLPCSKKSIYYTGTDVKTGESSTYQELDLSREEIQYQNTIIRWFQQWKKNF